MCLYALSAVCLQELSGKSFIRSPNYNLIRIGVSRDGIHKLDGLSSKALAHWTFREIRDSSYSGFSFTLVGREGGREGGGGRGGREEGGRGGGREGREGGRRGGGREGGGGGGREGGREGGVGGREGEKEG